MPRRECKRLSRGLAPSAHFILGLSHNENVTLIRTSPPPSEWGVVIDRTASGGLAERWRERDFPPPAFDYPGLPSWKDEDWFDFCVLGCSVVACLWPPTGEPVWATEFEGVWLDDAPGLFACFARQPLQVEDFLRHRFSNNFR